MANASSYLRDAIGAWIRGTSMPSAPAAIELALYTTPTDADGGGTEVVGGSYAAQTITVDAFTTGVTASNVVASFTGWPSGQIATHFAIRRVDNGEFLFHKALSRSLTTAAGNTLNVAAGDLTIQIA